MEIFDRPDQFEAALQQPDGGVELLVTGRGLFRAHLTRVTLPPLCLLHGEEFLSRIAVVSVAVGSLLVVLPIGPASSQIWGGVGMQGGEIMTVSPGGLVHARTTGPCRWGIICFPTAELARYGRTPNVADFAHSPGVRRWRPARASIQLLTGCFNAAVHRAETQPDAPMEQRAASGQERELIQALIDCLHFGPVDPDVTARQRHAAIMTRVENVLRAQPNRIPSVTEICGILGISQRTLLACCKEQVGMGPSRYFRLGRMRQVRRALIGTEPGATSVSQLAKFHGFNELGRFAGAYRRLFGELPSTSLRHGGGSARDHPVAPNDAGAPQAPQRGRGADGRRPGKRPTAD